MAGKTPKKETTKKETPKKEKTKKETPKKEKTKMEEVAEPPAAAEPVESEADRKKREAKEEKERLAAEKKEAERLEAERLEQEKLEAERLEAERIAREEAERLAREEAERKAEEERRAAEEAARLAKEEAERQERQRRYEAARAIQARMDAKYRHRCACATVIQRRARGIAARARVPALRRRKRLREPDFVDVKLLTRHGHLALAEWRALKAKASVPKGGHDGCLRTLAKLAALRLAGRAEAIDLELETLSLRKPPRQPADVTQHIAQSGSPYWYNQQTGKSHWINPTELW